MTTDYEAQTSYARRKLDVARLAETKLYAEYSSARGRTYALLGRLLSKYGRDRASWPDALLAKYMALAGEEEDAYGAYNAAKYQVRYYEGRLHRIELDANPPAYLVETSPKRSTPGAPVKDHLAPPPTRSGLVIAPDGTVHREGSCGQ